ncbi:MAG TPA: hypothetical protein VHY21_20280 [Pseudonocardiaceae bacterium]|nr:hypothetical protein [Pseudonocardiaceae bacterium]
MSCTKWQRGGSRLVRNPLRGYETPRLALRQGEIGSFSVEAGVDVLRCLNVFMYFDRASRERALDWAVSLLRPGGLVLCGSNWARSTSSRYTVYQEDGGTLVPREFAFSIENVRPLELAPWYALHDDDVEISATQRQWPRSGPTRSSEAGSMTDSMPCWRSGASARAGQTGTWAGRTRRCQ